MGLVGNYLAGNIYANAPCFSLPVIISLLNHTISGAVALFIWFSRLNKMELKNIPYTIGMFTGLMIICLIIGYSFRLAGANVQNYMFCFGGDGTPFDMYRSLLGYTVASNAPFSDLLSANQLPSLIGYQILAYLTQIAYMAAFYGGYYGVCAIIKKIKRLIKINRKKKAQ